MIDSLKRCIGDENAEMQKEVINRILKPYARELIFSTDDLAKKSPIGSFIYRILYKNVSQRHYAKEYTNIIKDYLKYSTDEAYNKATQILGILQSEDFKRELVNKSLKDTDLQVIGKIHTGFNGTLNNVIDRTVQMLLNPREEEKENDEIIQEDAKNIQMQRTAEEIGIKGHEDSETDKKRQDFYQRYGYHIDEQDEQEEQKPVVGYSKRDPINPKENGIPKHALETDEKDRENER